MPETREIGQVESELNKTKEETETKIQEETEVMNEVTELTETREIEETRGEVKETKDENTHMELARDNEGELGECPVTRCKQPDSLLQERGEGIFPLEADRDQVGPVELREVEGKSAANGCTRSLGVWRPREPERWRESPA